MTAEPVQSQSGRVLLTRPEGENEALCQSLQDRGLEVRILPLLAIHPLQEDARQRQIVMDIDTFGLVVVVSKPAARALLARIDHWWPQMPVGPCWFVLGAGTAAILGAAGITVLAPRDGHTSEALLADPRLPPAPCRALIVGGENGRDTLEEALSRRGHQTSRLILYERRPRCWPEADLRAHLGAWQPDAILVLSAETLHQLVTVGHNTGYSLRHTHLIVPSERVAAIARQYSELVHVLPAMTTTAQTDAICGALKELNLTGGKRR